MGFSTHTRTCLGEGFWYDDRAGGGNINKPLRMSQQLIHCLNARTALFLCSPQFQHSISDSSTPVFLPAVRAGNSCPAGFMSPFSAFSCSAIAPPTTHRNGIRNFTVSVSRLLCQQANVFAGIVRSTEVSISTTPLFYCHKPEIPSRSRYMHVQSGGSS